MPQSEFSVEIPGEKQLVCDHCSIDTFSVPCCLLPHRPDAISTDPFSSFVLLSHGLRERDFKRTRSRYSSARRNPASLSPSMPMPELQFLQIHARNSFVAWSWSQKSLSILPQHAQGVPACGCGFCFFSVRRTISASTIHGLHRFK